MSLEDYIDPLFLKTSLISVAVSVLMGVGYHIYKSIETGEWNINKQKAIYSEFNIIKENQKPDKKNYFDWASQALDVDTTKNYNNYFGHIRGELGKVNVDKPLYINDFKRFISIKEKD